MVRTIHLRYDINLLNVLQLIPAAQSSDTSPISILDATIAPQAPQAPQGEPSGDDVPWPRSGNYRCDTCGKYLSRQDALVRHTRLIHGTGQHFWCREPQCVRVKRGFRRFHDYRKHMRVDHNVVVEPSSQPSNNVAGTNREHHPRVRRVVTEPQFIQPYAFVPNIQYQVQPWTQYAPRIVPQPMPSTTPWQSPYTTPWPTPYAMPWQMPLPTPVYHPYQQTVVPGYMPDLAQPAAIAAGNAANSKWGPFPQFPDMRVSQPLYWQPQSEQSRAAEILQPQEPTQWPGGRADTVSTDGEQGLVEESLKQENAFE
ncbi:hypothetical protein F5Y03DRAFT_396126 [Xylaria venustula]|nr:hypothetical protein F5Y03DRAFT_396126 [Xylaria venustula]